MTNMITSTWVAVDLSASFEWSFACASVTAMCLPAPRKSKAASGHPGTVSITRLWLAGVTRAISHDYDVPVLVETLPDIRGPAVVSALRGVDVETPVVVVSGTADIEQRIQGLRAGADDYLAMPFSREEMLARVEALLRKMALLPDSGAIPYKAHCHPSGAQAAPATHRMPTARIHDSTYRTHSYSIRKPTGSGCTLDSYEKRSRRPSVPPIILTIRGLGYRFD